MWNDDRAELMRVKHRKIRRMKELYPKSISSCGTARFQVLERLVSAQLPADWQGRWAPDAQ